jgi:hypothetical protein
VRLLPKLGGLVLGLGTLVLLWIVAVGLVVGTQVGLAWVANRYLGVS